MSEEAGYIQAVENMAYEIDALSGRSMPQALEAGASDQSDVESFMSEEEISAWDELDRISETVCDTYNKSAGEFSADVFYTMIENSNQEVH